MSAPYRLHHLKQTHTVNILLKRMQTKRVVNICFVPGAVMKLYYISVHINAGTHYNRKVANFFISIRIRERANFACTLIWQPIKCFFTSYHLGGFLLYIPLMVPNCSITYVYSQVQRLIPKPVCNTANTFFFFIRLSVISILSTSKHEAFFVCVYDFMEI